MYELNKTFWHNSNFQLIILPSIGEQQPTLGVEGLCFENLRCVNLLCWISILIIVCCTSFEVQKKVMLLTGQLGLFAKLKSTSSVISCVWARKWCTPTKQGTSDILGKMSFWYHCMEHTFSFNLIPKSSSYSSYLLRYDPVYKTVGGFSGSVILRNLPLKFPSFGYDRLQMMQNFCGKMFEISQKLHGGDRNHIKVCKKKTKQNKNLKIDRWVIFHPICQLQMPISQNRPVWLVPCFVGVNHICRWCTQWNLNILPMHDKMCVIV